MRALIVSAMLLMAASASAQEVDWRGAGGGLFPGEAEVVNETIAAEAEVRLRPLDQPFQALIDQAADRHGIDPKLLHALVIVESAYRADAVSHAGAAGLTQLMPGTARDLGVADRFDVAANLDGGAAYLAQQLIRFQDVRLALAAYNAGPGRVQRLGRVPEIPETQHYVVAVIDCYLALTAGRGARNFGDCHAR